MMVYFEAEKVSICGEATEFSRISDSGNPVVTGFCPVCGSTLYLKTPLHPDGIGIAVGSIDDATGLEPLRSVFEENKHGWVEVPTAAQHFPRGRNG